MPTLYEQPAHKQYNQSILSANSDYLRWYETETQSKLCDGGIQQGIRFTQSLCV